MGVCGCVSVWNFISFMLYCFRHMCAYQRFKLLLSIQTLQFLGENSKFEWIFIFHSLFLLHNHPYTAIHFTSEFILSDFVTAAAAAAADFDTFVARIHIVRLYRHKSIIITRFVKGTEICSEWSPTTRTTLAVIRVCVQHIDNILSFSRLSSLVSLIICRTTATASLYCFPFAVACLFFYSTLNYPRQLCAGVKPFLLCCVGHRRNIAVERSFPHTLDLHAPGSSAFQFCVRESSRQHS